VATDNTTLTNSTADVIVDVVLPVTLLYFEAQKENETVLLTWSTATETNNDRFAIERSSNGITFEPIGVVNGNGNSSTILSYSYTDMHPLSGTSYYRLAQYDYDGTVNLSEVKTIQFLTDFAAVVSPNPFEQTANILVATETSFKIKITSLQGFVLEEHEYNTGNMPYTFWRKHETRYFIY